MIPELNTTYRRSLDELASPFERGAGERPLRLLVDWETIPSTTVAVVLQELSANPVVEIYGTRPSDSPRVEFVGEGDPSRPDVALISQRNSDGVSRVSLLEYQRHLDTALVPEFSRISERRLLESRLAVLCERAHMDALVTASPALLGRDPGLLLYGSPNILPPEQAIAFGGLFLRSRGEFSRTPRRPGWIDWKSGEDFYRALALTLLPSSRLWLGATLPRDARDIYDHTFAVRAAVAQSVTSQIARVLRARDELQVLRRGELTSDSAIQIAARFEYALISLHGAFDTLAHLCAVVYRMDKSPMDGWQRESWLKKLRACSDTAAVAAVAESKDVQRTLKLVGELRNTVHGPTLQPRLNTTARHRWCAVLVPPTRLRSFQTALAAWPEIPESWWGARYHHRGPMEFHERPGGVTVSYPSGREHPVAEIDIDPGICLERMLVFSLDAVDRLASAIEWERLGGLGFLPLAGVPPGDSFIQDRLRLLGGVSL